MEHATAEEQFLQFEKQLANQSTVEHDRAPKMPFISLRYDQSRCGHDKVPVLNLIFFLSCLYLWPRPDWVTEDS